MNTVCAYYKRRIIKVLLLAGVILACLAGAGKVSATPLSENGQLAVKGGKVVNEDGKSFVIKGVSTHGLSFTENGVPFKNYVNKTAFTDLRDKWGVNTVRLAMYTSEYNGYCVGSDSNCTTLKNVIKNGVQYAGELGMYVIIDWHILNNGSGNPLNQKSDAEKFFSEIARWVAENGYKNVIYELCNEPNSDGSSTNSWSHIKTYANAVIPKIRAYDKSSIIVVGTPTWSQDLERPLNDPVTCDTNLVYAFHFYAGTHQKDMRSRVEAALKKKLPVLVTEFGICDASGNGSNNKTQGKAWMDLLDQYEIGRVAWNLSCKNEASALIKSSCKKTGGWSDSDLSESGLWLKQTYLGTTAGGSDVADNDPAAGDFDPSKPADTPEDQSTGTPAPSGGSQAGQSTSGSSQNTASGTVSQTKTVTKGSAKKVRLSVKAYRESTWTSGDYTYSLYRAKITNKGKKTSKKWALTMKFSKAVSWSDKWCGSYSKSGTKLVVKPLSWNKKLRKNGSTEIGFILKSKGAQTLKSISISCS